MIDEAKIIVDQTFDIENQTTPFGKRYGGDVFTITEEDIEKSELGFAGLND